MHRSIGQRLTSGLLAGIFLLAGMADVYGLHRCPHHHRGRDSVQAVQTPGPHHAAVTPPSDGSGEDPGPDGGPCTCVGSCHGSAATPVVARAPRAPSTDLLAARRLLAPPELGAPATSAPAYLVPYPTGPPLIG